MQFVAVRDFRVDPGKVWRKLGEDDDVIVTSRGKPIAMLSSLSGETWEAQMRMRAVAKGMMAMQELRKQAGVKGTASLSEKEIEEEIGKTRTRAR